MTSKTWKLKTISQAAIPEALEKAERYRLLNEPAEAESICLDVLSIDPKNEKAKVTLILAKSDRLLKGYGVGDTEVTTLINGLSSEYERAYYGGIICERKAKAVLQSGSPHAHFLAYDLLTEAMDLFVRAEKCRPPENDDAILRWNTCVRLISQNKLRPEESEHMELGLE